MFLELVWSSVGTLQGGNVVPKPLFSIRCAPGDVMLLSSGDIVMYLGHGEYIMLANVEDELMYTPFVLLSDDLLGELQVIAALDMNMQVGIFDGESRLEAIRKTREDIN